MSERVTIRIDGHAHRVAPGRNLLEVALELGYDLPYFCWHPELGSIGACRQCAVMLLGDDGEKMAMACMTACEDGLRASIAHGEAAGMRRQVIEWLMVNHPHDCPVCDEGGECHLQDMTVMTGHTYRRYRFDKRTYRDQDLGPFVHHEMNRCIQCYRCVRFYKDFAGGRDLDVFGAHDRLYFGRATSGTLESPFSGNLVEVCPTGVFTDKLLRARYTRKWDLETAPSVCTHCGVGCNTTPGAREGSLRRIRNRYHGEVNGYFLCDRGRFGFGFQDHVRRLRVPLAPHGPDRPADRLAPDEAVERAAALLRGTRSLGVGSPRASLEANAALRALVGPERFVAPWDARTGATLRAVIDALRAVPAASPRALQDADAVLVLGEDLTATAPVMALNLRQASRTAPERAAMGQGIPAWSAEGLAHATAGRRGPFVVATPQPTGLDDAASEVRRLAPDALIALAEAVAAGEEPFAQRLREAEAPVVVCGASLRSPALIRAAARAAQAVGARIALSVPEANSLGLALLDPLDAENAPEADVLVATEVDLPGRLGSLDDALPSRRVLIEHVATPGGAHAEVVLPAATAFEADGTWVNAEGRAQRAFQVLPPAGDARATWRWLQDLAAALDRSPGWERAADVLAALARVAPVFEPLRSLDEPTERIPREPFRHSGRTALEVPNVSPPAVDPDGPYAGTMEGAPAPRAALAPEVWAPRWNSVQALNRFQEEIAGPLRGGDPGVLLLAPDDDLAPAEDVPEPEGPFQVVPLHSVHGSEPLSALTPTIAALTPAAAAALCAEDAEALGIGAGDAVTVQWSGGTWRLPVRLLDLPRGVVGLPVGLRECPLGPLPVRCEVTR